jgi:hypothetical protein
MQCSARMTPIILAVSLALTGAPKERIEVARGDILGTLSTASLSTAPSPSPSAETTKREPKKAPTTSGRKTAPQK